MKVNSSQTHSLNIANINTLFEANKGTFPPKHSLGVANLNSDDVTLKMDCTAKVQFKR